MLRTGDWKDRRMFVDVECLKRPFEDDAWRHARATLLFWVGLGWKASTRKFTHLLLRFPATITTRRERDHTQCD
jgi:hypothetical protein